MIDNSEAMDEVNCAINDWGHTMNATDFINSQRNIGTATRSAGRGRGIVVVSQNSLEQVRLAAQMNRLKAYKVPLGHLPNTEETLSCNPDEEITATLRTLGLYGTDGTLSATNTRPTVLDKKDIHVDGNVPVILNGELFHRRSEAETGIKAIIRPPCDTPYDPELPLPVQFSTITEFQHKQKSLEKVQPQSKSKTKLSTPAAPAKGKKTKWRKIPNEELVPKPQPRGRYDTDNTCMFLAGSRMGVYPGRVVFGGDKVKSYKQ